MDNSLGIYIHVPFCISKCHYCDFCSFPNTASDTIDKYVNELCRRIKLLPSNARSRSVDTVYFGGGTPSLLSPLHIEAIMDALCDNLHISKDAEITLECNPATADKQKLSALRSLGINRLSIGLQSADNTELKLLGRAHTAEDFYACYCDARGAGFQNISCDIMYGIPAQDAQSLRYSVNFLCELEPEHISAYGLMIEEGTKFFEMRDRLGVADDEASAELYLSLSSLLSSRGYAKYEISNFAKHGFESRHNMRYWLGKEYMGLGVAAHSYFGGERYGNSRDINAFLRGENTVCERELLTHEDRRKEYLMLRLRLADGFDTEEYKSRFGRDICKDCNIEGYISHGLMEKRDGRIFFTDKGFLVSNSILCDIIA